MISYAQRYHHLTGRPVSGQDVANACTEKIGTFEYAIGLIAAFVCAFFLHIPDRTLLTATPAIDTHS